MIIFTIEKKNTKTSGCNKKQSETESEPNQCKRQRWQWLLMNDDSLISVHFSPPYAQAYPPSRVYVRMTFVEVLTFEPDGTRFSMSETFFSHTQIHDECPNLKHDA